MPIYFKGKEIGNIIMNGGSSIIPEVGFVPIEWDSEGYFTNGAWYGDIIPLAVLTDQAKLKNIEIPQTVTTIEKDAFRNCNALAIKELPSSLTALGDRAFEECHALALTELPNGLTKIGYKTFRKCSELVLTYLPDGITEIGEVAFYDCQKLALTKLPSALTTIGTCAFQNCTNLKEITFLGTPNSIAIDAFTNCTNLTVINVPWAEGAVANAPWGANATVNYNYVDYVGFVATEWDSEGNAINGTWYGEEIPNYAFRLNDKLISVKMPQVTSIGDYAFDECHALALTELPSGLTKIGFRTFRKCYELALTELPRGITEIGVTAFFDCQKLGLSYLPDGLTIIKSAAFQACTNLNELYIYSTVETIQNAAFHSCTNLKKVSFGTSEYEALNPTPPSYIAPDTFTNCPNLTEINVFWGEGEVSGAPWGATNATINYNVAI